MVEFELSNLGPQFKLSILHYCQQDTQGGVYSSFVIAPNTTVKDINVTGMLRDLILDPFIQGVANAVGEPIARIHAFMEKKVKSTCEPMSLPRPGNLENDEIQAFR